MKIVAGLGCIDDYITLVKAGADEVFCGYVPYEWNKKYGIHFPLNRREALYYNVQVNSYEDMKILKKMVDLYKIPVSITFNSLYYIEEQYKIIAKIIMDLKKIGFNNFIIADIGLLLYLKENNIQCSIHLSGECTEINRLSIEFLNKFNISRYIFHRKNSISDMKSCIKENNKINKSIHYEAFILNELCHYTGAFCNSLHCDELVHLCKIPYCLSKINNKDDKFKEVDTRIKFYYEELENKEEFHIKSDLGNSYVLGSTGCGLCALKKLKKSGITHLKVVGRGNSAQNMKKDVENLKKAINMINEFDQNELYEKKLKECLFKGKCSNQCYY